MKEMIEIYPYLYRTASVPLFPFSSFKTNAYLLIRPKGNLLVYGPGKNIESYYDFIESKGGITKVLISHRDEATKYSTKVAERFNAQIYCPKLEEDEISKKCRVNKTFSGDKRLDDTFEIFAIPGHSHGSSCFLWTAPDKKRILFTGDSLYPGSDGSWTTYIMDKNNIPAAIKSLKKMRNLNPHVIVPAGYSNKTPYGEITNKEFKSIIDTAIDQIK